MPDLIAHFTIGSTPYRITANEGDARADWPGFNEKTRVGAHCTPGLDPAILPDAANLILDSNLGHVRITTTVNHDTTGKNPAGQCNQLYWCGARLFSIWSTDIVRGPEGLAFISAGQSPNGKPLPIVGNEISGTTAIFQVDLTY